MFHIRACPIWGPDYQATVANETTWTYNVESDRVGGPYSITREAEILTAAIDEEDKAKITTWIVEQRLLGIERPCITAPIIDNLAQRDLLPVHVRAERLLLYMVSQSHSIGTTVTVSNTTYEAYAWSESLDIREVYFLIKYLIAMGWLNEVSSAGGDVKVVVSVDGYTQLAEQTQNSDSSQAFVAMWFDEYTQELYDSGIRPAVLETGYEPMRIDKKLDVVKIDDEIIAQIRRSRFVVADFTHGNTGARGGVYFEAGFAYGLEIPVIHTCHEDMIEEIHFDTRQYSHILWKDVSSFRTELKNRILARFGSGPKL
ncbi:MAG: hypothetical protein OXD34_04635 [bacterium]|nr:hypothetical protein [bacterium]